MLTKDELAKLQTDGVEMFHLVNLASNWELVIRRPARKDCKRWRALANDPARRSDATEQLLMSCVVYPDVRSGAFDKLLDRFPLLPENGALAQIIGRVTGMLGGELSDDEKTSDPSAMPSAGI